MDPEATSAPSTRQVEIQQPRQPRGLTRDDYLTIYGPLGIGWSVLIGMLAVLWKAKVRGETVFRETLSAKDAEHVRQLEAKDRAHQAELERRDRECREERAENRDAMVALTREQAETMKQLDDRWRDHSRETRNALESATRKIGRRG